MNALHRHLHSPLRRCFYAVLRLLCRPQDVKDVGEIFKLMNIRADISTDSMQATVSNDYSRMRLGVKPL